MASSLGSMSICSSEKPTLRPMSASAAWSAPSLTSFQMSSGAMPTRMLAPTDISAKG